MDVISKYPAYLRQFNRDEYREAFGKYKSECGGFFAGLDEDSADGEIKKIMDFAENELKRRLGRKPKCFDLRCFLCVYLCPAAMDCGTDAAKSFAVALAKKWSEKYPEFSFEAGNFEDIASGFRTKPFGF